MNTIYLIKGGGQRVRQNRDLGIPTHYEVVEDSDRCDLALCIGQNFFANDMWSEDLEDIQRWANEWAGEEVILTRG
jgi:hypothetical protein